MFSHLESELVCVSGWCVFVWAWEWTWMPAAYWSLHPPCQRGGPCFYFWLGRHGKMSSSEPQVSAETAWDYWALYFLPHGGENRLRQSFCQPEWLQWALCTVSVSFMNGVNVPIALIPRWYLASFTTRAPNDKVLSMNEEIGLHQIPDTEPVGKTKSVEASSHNWKISFDYKDPVYRI